MERRGYEKGKGRDKRKAYGKERREEERTGKGEDREREMQCKEMIGKGSGG